MAISANLELIPEGGITAVPGVLAAGVACGLKSGEKDLALISLRQPAQVAAVFTTNQVKAAPVLLCQERLRNLPECQALVITSGYANACTGQPGMQLARQMAEATAGALGISPELVWVASTGVIGILPPLTPIMQGIGSASQELRIDGGHDAARAILTTDTRAKEVAVRVEVGGEWITMGGMAKGAGMICPQMATMLAFLATDARVEPQALQLALRQSVDASFNRITVDGDTSTNDMVVLLATGEGSKDSGRFIQPGSPGWSALQEGLIYVAQELAKKIVQDGEGATKFLEIQVKGARTSEDACKVAFSIANSNLVKTAFSGEQLNWGRILAAAGYAGVSLEQDRLELYLGGVKIVTGGISLGEKAILVAQPKLHEPQITVTLCLGLGEAEAQVWTCDLSAEYININADYHT